MAVLVQNNIGIYLQGTVCSAEQDAWAQRITIPYDSEITSLSMWMASKGGPTPTTVTAYIYSRDNGNPVSSLGSISIDASGWTTSGAARTFTFSSPITVSAGEYAIVLTEGVIGSVWVGTSTVPASPPYIVVTYDNGSTWQSPYIPSRCSWYIVYGNLTGGTYVNISGIIAGTSSMSGTLGMAAKNPDPANASSGMHLDWQTFSWESGSAVPPDDEVYNVYFGTDVDNLSLIVSEGPDINFAAAYLAAVAGMGGYSSTYYWRVDTYFQNSDITIPGNVWSFSTIVFDFPPGGARGVGGGYGGDDGSGEATGYGGGTFGDAQVHTKTRLIEFARNTLYYENL